MRMLRIVFAVSAVFTLSLLTGCSDLLLLHDWSPQLHATGMSTYTNYNPTPDHVAVLGVVTAQTEGTCVLGIVVQGKGGEGVLWEAANQKYGTDKYTGVKDISSSAEYVSVLGPLFSKVTTTYVGTVVREK